MTQQHPTEVVTKALLRFLDVPGLDGRAADRGLAKEIRMSASSAPG